VVSSDENGNFFKTISLDFRNNYHSAVGFSVPVDASNTYVDFRIGNKVYVKLKISTDITMEVFASEEFMSTLITKVRWGDCHKMTIKCTSCLLYYCRGTFWCGALRFQM
jgi:hypothetical protein